MLTKAICAARRRIISAGLGEWIERRLGLVLAIELVAGLLVSAGAIVAFAEIAEEVVEGEARRFDEALLLWIGANLPGWLYEPMRAVTALGYYKVVAPLLFAAACVFYRLGWRISAVLLVVSTVGGIVLTTVLKAVFARARPDIIDTGYTASFYYFPSGHATVAVGFYGTLALLVALRLSGFWRLLVAALGTLLVLLIGLSRLYLGVHYPTDILAGFFAALLWVSAVGFALFLYRFVPLPPRRSSRRKPRTETPNIVIVDKPSSTIATAIFGLLTDFLRSGGIHFTKGARNSRHASSARRTKGDVRGLS